MGKELIPILGAVMRTRKRRENDKSKIDHWPKETYNTEKASKSTVRNLHVWIDKNTTGRFYLEPTMVAFEDETDMILFKLGYVEPQ